MSDAGKKISFYPHPLVGQLAPRNLLFRFNFARLGPPRGRQKYDMGTTKACFEGCPQAPTRAMFWPQLPQTAPSDWSSPAAPPGTSIGHLLYTCVSVSHEIYTCTRVQIQKLNFVCLLPSSMLFRPRTPQKTRQRRKGRRKKEKGERGKEISYILHSLSTHSLPEVHAVGGLGAEPPAGGKGAEPPGSAAGPSRRRVRRTSSPNWPLFHSPAIIISSY